MIRASALLVVLALLGACATAGAPRGPGAPQTAKSIDAARFYSGTWYEIGRRPMSLTDGCVAGGTTYSGLAERRVRVRDFCHVGDPSGREKAIGGRGYFLDPGANGKLRVRYLGVIVWDYWVLDRAEDYSWFISADPTLTNLFIYTRDPQPSAAMVEDLTRRAAALGYDVNRLEFPAR